MDLLSAIKITLNLCEAYPGYNAQLRSRIHISPLLGSINQGYGFE